MLVGLFVVIPSFGEAVTIEELQAKIAELTAQLTALQQAQGGQQTWCHTFNTNLRFGDRNGEVNALQYVLQKEGFALNAGELGGETNYDDGIIGESTASAVVGFQEKYRGEILTPNGLKYGTGYVGPSTRAKLNQLYGCGTRVPPIPPIPPQPYITVLSPNGGERLYQGQTYDVLWSAPRGYFVGIFASPMAGGADVLVAPTYAQMNSPYYWTVPATVVPGDYRIKIQLAEIGNNNEILRFVAEDSSDAPFTVTSGTTGNNPPKIISVPPIPTSIQPGQSVSFLLSATDPDNDDLVWSVDWGDGSGVGGACPSVPSANKQGWNFSASHIWQNAGTYYVKFGVNDCKGGSDSYQIKISVGAAKAGYIQVLSPNGGETWTKGTTQTIQWRDSAPVPLYPCSVVSCPPSPPIYYDIELVSYYPSPCQPGSECPVPLPYTIANNVSGFSYSWSVGKIMTSGGIAPDGSYMVQICQSGTNICDASDSYFKVVSGIPEPYIQVLSPNGGEVWQVGSAQTVSLYAPAVPANTSFTFVLRNTATGNDTSLGEYPLAPNYWVKVPNSIPSGQYLFQAKASVNGNIIFDWSDAPFTVTSGTTAIQVHLDASNPGPRNITAGSTDVPFLVFRVTNTTSQAIAISSFSVNFLLGSTASAVDIPRASLWDGATKLAGANISMSGGTNFVVFNQGTAGGGLLSTVSPGASKIFIISADISPTARDRVTVAFNLYGFSFSPNGISTGMPVTGNSMTIVSSAQPSITVVAPNGGEVWSPQFQGGYAQQPVRWSYVNGGHVDGYLYRTSGGPVYQFCDFGSCRNIMRLQFNGPALTGQATILLPGNIIVANDYQVHLSLGALDGDREVAKDDSDAPFSIVVP